MSGLWKNLA